MGKRSARCLLCDEDFDYWYFELLFKRLSWSSYWLCQDGFCSPLYFVSTWSVTVCDFIAAFHTLQLYRYISSSAIYCLHYDHCCYIIFDVYDGSSLFLHGYGPFLLLTNLCASADVCLCGQLSQLCYMSPWLPLSAFKLFMRLDFVFCHGFVLIILFIIIKYSYSCRSSQGSSCRNQFCSFEGLISFEFPPCFFRDCFGPGWASGRVFSSYAS